MNLNVVNLKTFKRLVILIEKNMYYYYLTPFVYKYIIYLPTFTQQTHKCRRM